MKEKVAELQVGVQLSRTRAGSASGWRRTPSAHSPAQIWYVFAGAARCEGRARGTASASNQSANAADARRSPEQGARHQGTPLPAPTAPVLCCLGYRLQRQTDGAPCRGGGTQEARELAQKLQSEVDRLQADEAEDRLYSFGLTVAQHAACTYPCTMHVSMHHATTTRRRVAAVTSQKCGHRPVSLWHTGVRLLLLFE